MPTSVSGYFANNKRVPSVTTIIGRFKDCSGLLSYYEKCGRDGLSGEIESKRAATAGSATHDMIELWFKERPLPIDLLTTYKIDIEQAKWVEHAFSAFTKWHTEHTPRIRELEMRLVNEEFKFGGTLDAVGVVDGKLCLLDWKTSGRIYDDYKLQVAAYALLYEQETGQKLDQLRIVRFDKHKANYEQVLIDTWDEYTAIFLKMRELYGMLGDAKMLYYNKK